MSNVGMIVPLRGALVVCERPLYILRDRFNRLHAEGRPAIAYSDGYKLWALDGTRFDDELAQKFIVPSVSEIKKEDVLKIKNVEQRTAVIRRIGVKDFIKLLKPTVLDTQEGYELLRVNIGNAERIYIKMQNPSIDEVHIEAVHPECRTVNGALHWRNTGKLDGTYSKPLALT
jgi:hypothetical protein